MLQRSADLKGHLQRAPDLYFDESLEHASVIVVRIRPGSTGRAPLQFDLHSMTFAIHISTVSLLEEMNFAWRATQSYVLVYYCAVKYSGPENYSCL